METIWLEHLISTINWAGARVEWLWATTHVVGLNPGAIYWMEIWTLFTLICCKNLLFV